MRERERNKVRCKIYYQHAAYPPFYHLLRVEYQFH